MGYELKTRDVTLADRVRDHLIFLFSASIARIVLITIADSHHGIITRSGPLITTTSNKLTPTNESTINGQETRDESYRERRSQRLPCLGYNPFKEMKQQQLWKRRLLRVQKYTSFGMASCCLFIVLVAARTSDAFAFVALGHHQSLGVLKWSQLPNRRCCGRTCSINHARQNQKVASWKLHSSCRVLRVQEGLPMATKSETEMELQSMEREPGTLKNKNNNNHLLYLFSLPASNLLEQKNASSSTHAPQNAHAALLVRRLWEWKDDTLGDGRDFFVPRPKTLAALNQLLRQQLQWKSWRATECVVLSNCARFDVLVVVKAGKEIAEQEETLRQALAYSLLQQYGYDKDQKQRQVKKLFSLPSSLFDGGDQPQRLWLHPSPLPFVLCNDQMTTSSGHDHHPTTTLTIDSLDVKTVANSLESLEGPDTIARYLCRVATGLQAQGRRPDRQVVFRPFSSRDAHIMLQLKRTADIASAKPQQRSSNNNSNDITRREDGNSGASQPRLKALLDMTLQSGKAARDPDLVPAILPLKKYGSGGSSSRYSLGEAPADLSEKAAQQATELAIEPMVAKYVQKWKALEVSEQIQSFRLAVETAVKDRLGIDLETSSQAKPIRAMLHPHIMAIREGGDVDIDSVLDEIATIKVV